MKQGKTEKAVFAKLSKVEFASVQDYESLAEKLVSDILNDVREVLSSKDEVMSGAERLKKTISVGDRAIKQFLGKLDNAIRVSEKNYKDLEQAAKELGVDVPQQALKIKNELEKIAKRYSDDVKSTSDYFDRVYKGL